MKVLEQHQHTKHQISDLVLSKVPEVTLIFWITKILATTFGETAGDALSMSMNLGYLVSTFIFAAIAAAVVSEPPLPKVVISIFSFIP